MEEVFFFFERLTVNASKEIGINGKGVGLFVARMRRWRGHNPEASLEDYLAFLKQRGFRRWGRKKIHEIVDWFWEQEPMKALTEAPLFQAGAVELPQARSRTSRRDHFVRLAVAALIEAGLIESSGKRVRIRMKKIRAVANQL